MDKPSNTENQDQEENKEDLDREFALNTTCHGIKNVALSEYFPLKIFWTLVTLGAFVALFTQIFNLFDDYFDYPTLTLVSKEVHCHLCIHFSLLLLIYDWRHYCLFVS